VFNQYYGRKNRHWTYQERASTLEKVQEKKTIPTFGCLKKCERLKIPMGGVVRAAVRDTHRANARFLGKTEMRYECGEIILLSWPSPGSRLFVTITKMDEHQSIQGRVRPMIKGIWSLGCGGI
jgi:hypothetical protein